MKERRRNNRTPKRFRSCRGITLVEVQVAAMIGIMTFLTIVDYARVQSDLVGSIEQDRWADGTVDASEKRLVLVSADVGKDAAIPACEIRIADVEFEGLYPTVEVVVRQRGL